MKILVTGIAGFIGYFVAKALSEMGIEVIGVDNLNTYYDVRLKLQRLSALGIKMNATDSYNTYYDSSVYPTLRFVKIDLEDKEKIEQLFREEKFDRICHLAAQAGVRYSMEKPFTYLDSNIYGFMNILECCRNYLPEHLVYASSSSVYGLNSKVPFSEEDSIAHPVSLYAVTKKANELMAHTYSHLYNIPTTGLRFFTVYGPWGRPDMSPFLFMDAIFHDRPINVFNNGDMLRDFTYISDIVEGIIKVMDKPAETDPLWSSVQPDPGSSKAPYKIYNIGNSSPVKLMDFIETIEYAIGKKANKIFLPMQPGDVYQTYADINKIKKDFGFSPSISLQKGVQSTVEWFREYYNI